MEIDETFSSIEEIQTLLEKEGMTWRISVDEINDDINADTDDDIDDEIDDGIDGIENDGACSSKIVLESVSFSADADTIEIEKWEAELPDIDEKEENESNESEEFEENDLRNNSENDFEKAEVIYFDLFKKKTYTKTLIFQTEDENESNLGSKSDGNPDNRSVENAGKRIYRLIGFCEAPMS
ncbi:hypothetical protein MmiHf6_16170 [Methanimicrococcus hongohii]|uniref:Uncharacterized protein n=1 Tax=Methanimicrococcus hongohii TaxID=3028295 RepID=A0AA96VCF5_9EURY|nr:hypothetical protein [Methanimicrococcus sp. Hf6]WNY24287.1 hypothetical protein MmiHf6_16170 [Methanimicrococcus sp. Hf6]